MAAVRWTDALPEGGTPDEKAKLTEFHVHIPAPDYPTATCSPRTGYASLRELWLVVRS